MTSFKTYPQPPNHKTLRAILALVNSAAERGDIESLRHVSEILYDNLPALSAEDNKNLTVLIHGNVDKINNSMYKMFTDKDIEEVSATLQKQAYGDFSEALYILTQDLRKIDTHIRIDQIESDIFDPEYFTGEQKDVWHKFREPLSMHPKNPKGSSTKEAEWAIKDIRAYQQALYGPLIPTIAATYIKRRAAEEGGDHGVTVTLAYDDPALIVRTHAPFTAELDEYFIHTAPIESRMDFTPKNLPKSIGGYELVGTAISNLFRYEIN